MSNPIEAIEKQLNGVNYRRRTRRITMSDVAVAQHFNNVPQPAAKIAEAFPALVSYITRAAEYASSHQA